MTALGVCIFTDGLRYRAPLILPWSTLAPLLAASSSTGLSPPPTHHGHSDGGRLLTATHSATVWVCPRRCWAIDLELVWVVVGCTLTSSKLLRRAAPAHSPSRAEALLPMCYFFCLVQILSTYSVLHMMCAFIGA